MLASKLTRLAESLTLKGVGDSSIHPATRLTVMPVRSPIKFPRLSLRIASTVAAILVRPDQNGFLRPARPDEEVTHCFPPEITTLEGQTNAQLNVPAGANRATITVLSGPLYMGLVDASTAPEYQTGSGIADLRDAQLAALRITGTGTYHVDYSASGGEA